MATVKTNKMYLYEEDFTRRITVRSDGRFYCKVPEQVVTVLGLTSDEISADTLCRVESLFAEKLSEAKEATMRASKVILYRLSINGSIPGRRPFDEISFCRGFGMSVEAGVFIRREYARGTSEAHAVYEEVPSSIPDGALGNRFERLGQGHETPESREDIYVIEWTEEREAFFARVCASMIDMITKLEEFRGPQEIMKLSDQQWKLLADEQTLAGEEG